MTLSVLIVDDYPPDIVYTRRILKRNVPDVQVYDSSSGEHALRRLREIAALHAGMASPPALLVLLDVNMPGMDGFDTLDAYEREAAGVLSEVGAPPATFVFLSSSREARELRRADGYPQVHGYIQKPLRPKHARDLASRFARGSLTLPG